MWPLILNNFFYQLLKETSGPLGRGWIQPQLAQGQWGGLPSDGPDKDYDDDITDDEDGGEDDDDVDDDDDDDDDLIFNMPDTDCYDDSGPQLSLQS